MDCSESCPTAAVMFGVPGVRVLAAERERGGGLLLTVEPDRHPSCPPEWCATGWQR